MCTVGEKWKVGQFLFVMFLSLTLMDNIVLIDGFIPIVSVELWFDEMTVWTARKGVLIFTDTSIFSCGKVKLPLSRAWWHSSAMIRSLWIWEFSMLVGWNRPDLAR